MFPLLFNVQVFYGVVLSATFFISPFQIVKGLLSLEYYLNKLMMITLSSLQ